MPTRIAPTVRFGILVLPALVAIVGCRATRTGPNSLGTLDVPALHQPTAEPPPDRADGRLLEGELRIPCGQTAAFDFGQAPRKDTTVILDIVAWLDSEGPARQLMKITLDDHPVLGTKSRTGSRLVNKPIEAAAGSDVAWFRDGAWRVLPAPRQDAGVTSTSSAGTAYRTALDVTDLANPDGRNRLQIVNTCTPGPAVAAAGGQDIILKTLALHVVPGASALTTLDDADKDVIADGTRVSTAASYKATIAPGGGFSIESGGRTLRFSSVFSYPDSGLNKLVAADKADKTGQAGWRVDVERTENGGVVTGEGPDYRLRRTLRFTPAKVEVSDEITSLHQYSKLGLMVQEAVDLNGLPQRVRLAGNPDPTVNTYYSPGNPSVYVNLDDFGLGILTEDDVFRNQAILFFDVPTSLAGIKTEKLCLPPGGSYVLRWSAYVVSGHDYYDFINLVRRDWGSNYTVEGAWAFFDPDSIIAKPLERIREEYTRQGIRFACMWGGWIDPKHDPKHIGFGTGVFDPYWADFRERVKLAAAKIRAAVPGCKVYLYYDTQRDTTEGGADRYRDSWLTHRDGKQDTTEWDGMFSLTRDVVATLDDAYGKAMLETAGRYLTELKGDGLYWDEMEAVDYGSWLTTYSQWDGYSCELDPKTHAIQREVGITSMLGEAHKLAVIDRVRAMGGDIMGNTPAFTKKLLAKKAQRMVEIQHNTFWNYEGNLDSPLGYAEARLDFGNWIRALQMATLLVGTRSDYAYDIQPYVFPFTPIELHAGYLLGQERIIATHSGNYGWPGERALVSVRGFDEAGKLIARDLSTVIGVEARTRAEVAKGEALVLIKLPVSVEPFSGEVTASQVDYSSRGLKVTLAAPRGCALAVQGGDFRLVPGQIVAVTRDGVAKPAAVGQDGVLRVDVAAASASVKIEVKTPQGA